MPQWTDAPPAEDDRYAHGIIRTPATTPIAGIITSPTLIGTMTHFVNHRTIPCQGAQQCEFCDTGHSRRWHGYVALLLYQTQQHEVFELTAKACDPLKNYALVHQTLRACGLRAWRPSKRTNGRVVVETKHVDEQRVVIPAPFDVREVLCHIWNVQNTDATVVTGRAPCLQGIGLFDSGNDGRQRGNGNG